MINRSSPGGKNENLLSYVKIWAVSLSRFLQKDLRNI